MTLRATAAAVLIAMAGSTAVPVQGRDGSGVPSPGGTPPGSNLPPPEQDAKPDPPQAPAVFRGGVTVVQIDALVTDAQGKPVTGLMADDFEVLESGEPRAVSSFAEANIPLSADVSTGVDVESDVASNTTPEGRKYVIAFDEVSPDRVLLARNVVRRFVNEHLGPRDVAAVVLTGRGLASSGQDFTSSRSLLLKAIDKFTGGFEPSTPNVEVRPGAGDAAQQEDGPVTPDADVNEWSFQGPGEDKAFSSDPRQLASSLRKLTEFMAALPGRKTLLYVGEGLGGLDFFDVVDYHGGALTPAAIDAHAAVAAATRGNVTIYPIDPRRLTTDLTPAAITGDIVGSTILDNRADVAALADVTGGFSFTSSNSVETAFDRVVTENSSYYTLGFDSGYTRRDGRFVPVEVRVRRPGLRVRSRKGYVAPLGEERQPERTDSDTRLRAVADALAAPIATRGIPLRVFAAPYKGTPKKAIVALAIEIDGAAVGGQDRGGTRTSDLEITYFATNDRGSVVPGRRHTALLSRTGSTTNEAWVRVLSQIELEAGRYQLRVAAGTAFNAGSVVYDLEVPNFTREPLMMSGVALTSSAAGAMPTERPQDPLGAALPAPPTASRDFRADETIALFAEVYDNRATKRNQAPPAIEVTASLLSERDRVIRFARAEPLPSTMSRHNSDGHGFATSLAFDVPPGTYVLSVEARSGDASAVRRIPVRVR